MNVDKPGRSADGETVAHRRLGGASGIRTLGTIICSGLAFAAFLGMVSAKGVGMSAREGSRSATWADRAEAQAFTTRVKRYFAKSDPFLTCFAELKERSCAPRWQSR
jgi:hypothetical protein